MSQKIAAKLIRAGLSSKSAALEPRDPLYETQVDPKTGKRKRTQRSIPPGLSKHEEKVLKKIRKRAHYLDKGFSFCGFRFGWTFLIGFLPVIGDVADAALSYYLVIRPARECNLPSILVQRMLMNQILVTTVGLIPIVGDIIMAIWKVNSRNAALFEDFLSMRGQRILDDSSTNQVTLAETSALVENSKRATYIDGMTGQREPMAQTEPSAQSTSAHTLEATKNPESTTTNKIRKWFSKPSPPPAAT